MFQGSGWTITKGLIMPPATQGNPLMQFFPLIVLFLFFYFIILRPEKNKQKEHKQKIANLKKNDQVVTAGGVHATIVNVKESTVVVRIDDNVKVEVDKEAVSTVKNL